VSRRVVRRFVLEAHLLARLKHPHVAQVHLLGKYSIGGVDLPDPKMHKDEMNADGTPKFKLERFTGPLFLNEPTPGDVRQGAIGNCYFPAALASVAAQNPQAAGRRRTQDDPGHRRICVRSLSDTIWKLQEP
jgi:hypothetical protein